MKIGQLKLSQMPKALFIAGAAVGLAGCGPAFQPLVAGKSVADQSSLALTVSPSPAPGAPQPSATPTATPAPTPTATPTPAPTPKIGSNSGIMWGINGHPIQGGIYSSIPLSQQMAQVAALGLKSYRMDLYGSDSVSLATLQATIAAAQPYGILILPVLIPDPLSYASETDAYNAGYALGQAYASDFPNIPVWELGNEYDGQISISGDGSSISQYDQAQYVLVRGTLHGLLDGIHAGNPSSKGAIDTEGACHYGLTDGLWADGVQWDITGEHWYELAGDIQNMTGICDAGAVNKLAILQSHYGMPIWITEYNDNVDPQNKANMASYLTSAMSEWNGIARQYDIEAAHIYELYDQSELSGVEANFGIADGNGNNTAAAQAVESWLRINPSVTY